MTIKVGDTVVFKGSVIKRCNHSEYTKNFRGVVVKLFGSTCDVETLSGVRAVPTANIVPVKDIFDSRTQTNAKVIIDLS